MFDLLDTLLEEACVIVEKSRESTHRDFQFHDIEEMIKVAVGMRRSGKTYCLYQKINELLDQGVTREQILFLNFEDDRLLPMNAQEMGRLIDLFYARYPENHHRRCYLFLDEVQNIKEWHLVVRRYFDTKDVQLYLTGSSAKLLSKEINTSLRGRSLATEIYPFSFQEYLRAHKIRFSTNTFGKSTSDILYQHFLSFLDKGGFPAVQKMQQDEWRDTLQNYLDTVILRDIVERHNVSNIALLRYLALSLLKNSSTVFSINKFYNDLKSQGFRVNKDTLYDYLDYLQNAFCIFRVPFYSESPRVKQTRPHKIYSIDSGLVQATTISFSHNTGRLFENLVYLDLRRENKQISFYNTSSGYEIDFVTLDAKGNRELLQVVLDDRDVETRKREERALAEAEQELGIKGRIISAHDYLKNFVKSH